MDPASSLFIQEHTLLFFSVHPQVRKNHTVHYLQLYRIGKQLLKIFPGHGRQTPYITGIKHNGCPHFLTTGMTSRAISARRPNHIVAAIYFSI